MGRHSTGYMHFFPPARSKGDYPSKYTFTLVQSISQLAEIFERYSDVTQLGLDTETTGLDHTREITVGFSFACDLLEGFYVPVRHSTGNIDLVPEAFSLLGRFIADKVVFYYNKRFDLRMLKKEGIDPRGHRHFDVMVLSWLTDTNVQMPTLKDTEKHFLGWDAPSFDESFEGGNVQLTNPVDACQYAATDALGTLHLAKRLPTLIPKCGFISRLDNRAVDVVKEIEETPILVDTPYLRSLAPEISLKINKARIELFKLAGRTFDPGSPEQVSNVLVENGCAPANRTPTGKVSTNAKDLIHIKHPLVEAILEYRKYATLQSSYVDKLILEASRKKGYVNVNHMTFKVPTGRFATGSDSKNPFFSRVNIQSIVKPGPAMFWGENTGDPEQGIFGWIFHEIQDFDPKTASEKYPNLIEGFTQKINIRKAFVPPPGFTWVSIDYAAQELRLPANFSKEPVFVQAFKTGQDLHKQVAIAMLPAPYDKKKRGIAKVLNFGLMFLGTAWTIMNKLGCPKEVAEDYVKSYEKAHKTLYLWKSAVIRRGKRTGTVSTYYGRPRRLRHWYSSKDYKQVKFAHRSAVNSTVQGTGSDIIRIAMVRVDDNLYKKQAVDLSKLPEDYSGIDILFHPLVHDEINYLIRTSKLVELVPQVEKLMTVQEKDWPVPMTVETEFGDSWGSLFPFIWKEGTYVPKFES